MMTTIRLFASPIFLELVSLAKASIIPIALGLLSPIVKAQEDALSKYRNYTPQQIAAMPREERSSSVPIIYTWAARNGFGEGHELLIGQQLNSLMYSGLHDYTEAIKAFQLDLGEKPTGTLTVWQLYRLQQYSEMQKLDSITFPQTFLSWKSDNFATISGTLTILDERISRPINHIEISCYRRDESCSAKQIDLIVPSEDSFSQNYLVYRHPGETYKITNWAEDEIQASPASPGNGCRVTSYTFNFTTKEFYHITRNGGGDCNFGGVDLPPLAKPRISQIVDGSDIMHEEFTTIRMDAYNKFSSAYRQQLEKIVEKSKQENISK